MEADESPTGPLIVTVTTQLKNQTEATITTKCWIPNGIILSLCDTAFEIFEILGFLMVGLFQGPTSLIQIQILLGF